VALDVTGKTPEELAKSIFQNLKGSKRLGLHDVGKVYQPRYGEYGKKRPGLFKRFFHWLKF
jgi:hypothetical protein